MTNDETRAQFNDALGRTTDPDARARIELAREYFCNPDFRERLAAYTFDVTYKMEAK